MSEHMGKSMNRPRLCSIRISSEGAATTNILLENAGMSRLNCDTVSILSQGGDHHHQQPSNMRVSRNIEKQVYTKRSKYLDEELNDSKEVIVCVDKRPAADASAIITDDSNSDRAQSRALIELNNKADVVEKYGQTSREPTMAAPNEVKGVDQSAFFLMDDPVPVVESLHVMDMTKAALPIVTATAKPTLINPINSNNNNNKSVNNIITTNANLNGSGVCSSLRQEQLDRVAVWVQQSNEQKQNHTTPESNHHHQHHHTNHHRPPQQMQLQRNKGSHCNGHDDDDSAELLSGSNDVSQLTSSPVRYSGDGAVCIDIEEAAASHQNQRNSSSGHGGGGVVSATMDSDNIAQMEYNVKQFLLKQNEWSIGGGGAGVSAVPLPGHVNSAVVQSNVMCSPMSSSMSITSFTSNNNNNNCNSNVNNLRTETNL